MFTSTDVAEYYNLTQVHYEKWWNLKKSLSLHYGIWDDNTKNFTQSLINTNKVLMSIAAIKDGEKILDAGCGVGGAAIFLSKQKDVDVTGITLSERQLAYAIKLTESLGLKRGPKFLLMDYTKTSFEDESFDVVWACESVSSAPQKELFIKEAYRILKRGGRLVLSDYFLTSYDKPDPNSIIKKWVKTWGISSLVTAETFKEFLSAASFDEIEIADYTTSILKSARRMYIAGILACIPSEMYNLFHSNVSRFAKHHYRSGYYQYKALQKNLWNYLIISAKKK
jgi:tocopherol O-methyltransferase